jgi:hypothetical protein
MVLIASKDDHLIRFLFLRAIGESGDGLSRMRPDANCGSRGAGVQTTLGAAVRQVDDLVLREAAPVRAIIDLSEARLIR